MIVTPSLFFQSAGRLFGIGLLLFFWFLQVAGAYQPTNETPKRVITPKTLSLPGIPELKKLDANIYSQSLPLDDTTENALTPAVSPDSVLKNLPLLPPPAYRAYLEKVGVMSENLLDLKQRFERQRDKLSYQNKSKKDFPPQIVLSLQELGAITQRLSVDNNRFKSTFENGESQYQSYQLIETSVNSLEDAIAYWRLSNRYRELYRAEAREKIEDDELLTVKLQTALNAIDALRTIQTMRDHLKKLDADTYP